MRLLGLDYGRKRIGVSLSDPLGMTAQPYGAITMGPKAVDDILRIVADREVTEIVLGYPKAMSGEAAQMAGEVEKFAERLRKKLSCPIHFWDERLTTAESENLLVAADVRRAKRKEVRDAMAATLILQGFLDARSNGRP